MDNHLAGGIAEALRHHIHWQQHLLKRLQESDPQQQLEHEPKFLVLRPGDRSTVCTTGYLASGRCFGQRSARRSPDLGPHDPHWDEIVVANRSDAKRLLPGLGNIAAALASSAAVAMLSRRVLLCENWTIATESFDAPLNALVLGRSGWEPYLARAQLRSRAETFITSDDTSLATTLCSHDMRHGSTTAAAGEGGIGNSNTGGPTAARVWRIFSNRERIARPFPLFPRTHAHALSRHCHKVVSTWLQGGSAFPTHRLTRAASTFTQNTTCHCCCSIHIINGSSAPGWPTPMCSRTGLRFPQDSFGRP